MIQTVAIAGVGLIGGSFALALREAGFKGRILGVSSPKTLERARELGVIDEGAALESAAAEADLIYLAQPIRAIIAALPVLARTVRPGVLVTDAGSTKRVIVDAARVLPDRCVFLGGHPMAGKETTGVSAADATLFRGRPYLLTPVRDEDLQTDFAAELRTWLDRIGARVMIMSPGGHDELIALLSHLPQMASTALTSCLADEIPDPQKLDAAGPGLRDMSRLALSSFDVWGDILATNAEPIRAALDRYIARLTVLRDHLTDARMRDEFARGAGVARRVRG